ncbi:hypothetical protein O5O45_24885 [Hahella aquimaris]|uniref:hypothetical protein n=1 Tax=Hahella sp. HNIBRBA332 TaxID=3015983 RepID=UPI00273CD0A6|nr:hypothetical protein [Hahella sp. HNIBRBA332]WLQ12968.1 hypothetical protein O5O45_24885 [Hahella sp. HNIBRBA332]
MISTNPKKPFAYLAAAALSTFVAAPAMAAPAPTPHHFVIEQDFELGMRTYDPIVIDGVTVFRWWGNPSNPSVSNERPKDGNYSMKFEYKSTPDAVDSSSEQRFEIPAGTSELTIQYDLFIPENFYHRTQDHVADANKRQDNNKFLVLWSGIYSSYESNNSAAFEYHPSLLQEGASKLDYHLGPGKYDDNHKWPTTDHIIDLSDAGQWVNYKVHVKFSEEGKSNGEITWWKNGSVYYAVSGLNNYSGFGNYIDKGYLLGWSNSGFSEETVFYLDNLRIDVYDYIYKNTTLFKLPQEKYTSYDLAQDKGVAEDRYDDLGIKLTGNAWKKIEAPYTITPDTVLEFDYVGDVEAEIEAIGFANTNYYNKNATFKLSGTQNAEAGIRDFDNYPNDKKVKHYEIPVGEYLSGEYRYLTFIRDNDVASPTGYSLFSNIRFYEKETTNN